MVSERQKLENASLGALADALAGPDPGSVRHNIVNSEFVRRQTAAAIEATEAQVRAADAQEEAAHFAQVSAQAAQDTAKATKDTADATQRSARYVLASVIILALSSVANLIVSIWGVLAQGHH